ncbi:uncharacterized protein [Euphorbia lathyris]|uniref:uncharacterized protein isoform X2 n=1 Tax=Euphorbia lathyris TaxID=212925 RepID=UPI00331431FB
MIDKRNDGYKGDNIERIQHSQKQTKSNTLNEGNSSTLPPQTIGADGKPPADALNSLADAGAVMEKSSEKHVLINEKQVVNPNGDRIEHATSSSTKAIKVYTRRARKKVVGEEDAILTKQACGAVEIDLNTSMPNRLQESNLKPIEQGIKILVQATTTTDFTDAGALMEKGSEKHVLIDEKQVVNPGGDMIEHVTSSSTKGIKVYTRRAKKKVVGEGYAKLTKHACGALENDLNASMPNRLQESNPKPIEQGSKNLLQAMTTTDMEKGCEKLVLIDEKQVVNPNGDRIEHATSSTKAIKVYTRRARKKVVGEGDAKLTKHACRALENDLNASMPHRLQESNPKPIEQGSKTLLQATTTTDSAETLNLNQVDMLLMLSARTRARQKQRTSIRNRSQAAIPGSRIQGHEPQLLLNAGSIELVRVHTPEIGQKQPVHTPLSAINVSIFRRLNSCKNLSILLDPRRTRCLQEQLAGKEPA